MSNRTIKFKFWSPQGKAFVENYKYNGFIDELFQQDDFLIPCQFTGLKDFEGTDVYENDIIVLPDIDRKFKISFKFGSFCAETIEPTNIMNFIFMHQLERFKVVGSVLIDLDSLE